MSQCSEQAQSHPHAPSSQCTPGYRNFLSTLQKSLGQYSCTVNYAALDYKIISRDCVALLQSYFFMGKFPCKVATTPSMPTTLNVALERLRGDIIRRNNAPSTFFSSIALSLDWAVSLQWPKIGETSLYSAVKTTRHTPNVPSSRASWCTSGSGQITGQP